MCILLAFTFKFKYFQIVQECLDKIDLCDLIIQQYFKNLTNCDIEVLKTQLSMEA